MAAARQAIYPSPAEITLTYAKPDGAEGEQPADVSYDYGDTVTVDTTLPYTKDGYKQTGWSITKTDGMVGTSPAVSSFTILDSTTLYPVFARSFTDSGVSAEIELAYNEEIEDINLSDYIEFVDSDTFDTASGEFTFALANGYELPDGLELKDGVISGTPKASGTFEVKFTVTDNTPYITLSSLDSTEAAVSATLTLTFTVKNAASFAVTDENGDDVECEYSDNTLIISEEGTYTITMADGTETTTDTIKVTVEEGESVTIILDGVSITSDSTPAIEVSGGGSVTIILVGENTLTAADDDTAGVTVTDGSTLEITGTGGLTADAVSGDTDSTITVTGGSYSDSAVVEEYIADNYSSHDNTGTYDCVVVSDSQQLIVTGGVGYTYDEETGTITITDGGDYTISMNEKAFEDIETATATDTIVIASDEDVTITLDDVTIESDTSSPLEVDGEGDVTIILSGDNTLTATGDGDAGLQKTSTDNTLTIVSETDDDGSETGSLTATGGSGAAGIGGGSGEDGANITIESGTVTATGGENAAGIGGGDGGDGTDIVISGGDVTASAGNTEDNGTASAVGGGDGGESSGIEVSCGTYNTDVTGSTADNYYSYDNDNGTYTVVRSASTVYNTAQTSTHSVTLDGLYAQLDKADAIDHSEAAEYKVVLEDLSADDEAKLESESAFANADLTFAADIKVVKYKSDGSVDTDFDYNEVLGTSLTQDVSVTFPVPVENPKVYHINSSNVLETLDTGKVSLSEDKYTVTFTADSFSVYGTAVDETTLSAGDYATNAYLQLEQQTSGVAGVYNLNLYGDKDGSDAPIYRFYEADLKLAFEDGYDITKIGAVTVTASDGIEITQGSDGEYIFTIEDTATSDCVSAYGINLGTVTVNGIGSYKLGIDESYTNRALCRDNTQSIVSSFTYGITPAQSTGNLYLNNIPVEGSTKLATSTLTVNVMFANDVKSADTDYTAMQVAYSNLSESGTVYLGSDSKTTGMTYSKITTDISSDWNGYTFTIDVPTNYTTSLTFSGDGYRTYNVSVVPTDNASVTVWNNALDSAVAVTKNSANSITADVTFLAGDIVADGVINLYDLSAVTSYFGADLGTAYSTFTRYDLNRDGKIDSRDIAMVLVSWNK